MGFRLRVTEDTAAPAVLLAARCEDTDTALWGPTCRGQTPAPSRQPFGSHVSAPCRREFSSPKTGLSPS